MTHWISVIVGLSLLTGCAGPRWHSDAPQATPADFSLSLLIVADDEGDAPDDPLHTPSYFLLENDRTLRVAVGPGSVTTTYPPPTATISPAQVDELYRLIRRHDLLTSRTAAPANDASVPGAPDTTYRLLITIEGRQHRVLAHRDDATPGLMAVVRQILEFAGRLPPPSSRL